MTDQSHSHGFRLATGAAAGAFSSLVFCVVHQILISSIWFSIVALLVAGAVSGTCLAWSYSVGVRVHSTRRWFQYNGLYVAILVVLGLTSVVMFDPVTTIPQLIAAQAPPRALIGRALPVTLGFTAASAALLCALYRPRWAGAAAILVTTVVIVLFLGLNISILGLVSVPTTSLWLLGEVLLLIVSLAAVYAATAALLWRTDRRELTR